MNQYIVTCLTRLSMRHPAQLSKLSIEAECAEQAEEKAMGYDFVISVNQLAEVES